MESAEPHQAPAAPVTAKKAGADGARLPPTLAGAHSLSSPSPQASREVSPARTQTRTAAPPAPPATTSTARARIPSRRTSTDVSPSRGTSSTRASSPSAAALQRALSSTSIPQPSTTSSADPVKPSRTARTAGTAPVDSTPHWPISPRLRSPPPSDGRSGSRSRANSLRRIKKPEAQSTPAIVVQSSSPAPGPRFPVREEPGSDLDDAAVSMKAPSRGASGVAPKLETVQESSGSLPATPGFDGVETDRYAFPAFAPLFVIVSYQSQTATSTVLTTR
jgi:hypothetical protein